MPEVYENMNVLHTLGHLQDYSYPFEEAMNSLGILSPSNSSVDSQMTSSTPSPMSISTSPSHTSSSYITLPNATMWGKPYIEIIEQPVDKFRFRYKSEMMGTHGSLAGANSSNSRKKQAPTVELKCYPGVAVIRCTLVTADPDHRSPHAHRLVRRVGNQDEDDPHDIKVSPEIGFQASFHGMGIIHTAKKNIKDELVKKKRFIALQEAKQRNINATTLSVREETEIKMEAEAAQKWMGLNSVTLCFQAFSQMNNGVLTPITDPVYSTPINNLKSALTGELKICRIDKTAGSCNGNDEVFMLVEKVGKKNIKIKFFETNQDDQEIWAEYGRFSELDVHHQYAIVFRTPPYRDADITEPKEVFIQLYRPSDGDRSEPVKFTYKPSDAMIGRKRARISFGSSDFLTPTVVNNISLEEPLPIHNSNVQNSSMELRKLISDTCGSEELKDFFNNLDCDDYLRYCDTQLTTDGPSKKKETHSFADTIVKDIRSLLKSGDPKLKDRILALLKERTVYGDSPLHSALRHNQLNLVKCILFVLASNPVFKPIIDAQTSSGRTCLHYAVEQNQPDVTKALLLLGADANACDEHGSSPLHVAVKNPEAGACVEMLLKEGNVIIEARDDAGWSALHLAAEAGSIRAIEALVKAKIDVNSTDMSYGRTALHIAVEGGHKEIVQFLLKKTKIDVNKRNFSGNTALHSAVVNTGERAKELCELLIKHGANPSIPNHNRESTKESRTATVKNEMESEDEDDQSEGQTSFDLASNKPEILQLFAASGPTESVNTVQRVTIKQEVEDMQEELDIDEEAESSLLDEETLSLLAPILDESKSWIKLAKALGYEYLQPALENSPTSPSRTLFNYMDIKADVEIKDLRSLLAEFKETKAVQLIDQMISRRKP